MRRAGGGGRQGGTGAPALNGSLTSFFSGEPPPGVPKVGGCCRFHIRATAEGAGLGGAGGEGSIFLCLPSIFHLGLWAGGDRKDRPTVGALSWGQGGALSNPPKGEMVKGVSVRP